MDNLKFKLATYNNWAMLLEWRNDEDTRKNSFSSKIISASEHKKWLSASIENPNREIFIVTDNKKPVGTLRVDVMCDKREISWTIAPASRGKGYGKKMVRQLVNSLSVYILAKIKVSNYASIKVAEYAGLKYYKKDKNVLYYIKEVKNEN